MWESIKSLLSAGVSNSNSSRVTAWLNSHTPAKSPIRHNRFMWLCSIVLHVAWKREKGGSVIFFPEDKRDTEALCIQVHSPIVHCLVRAGDVFL